MQPAATTPSTVPGQRLYTAPEVIAHLRLSRATLYRMMATGELQYVKMGRSVRFTQGALDAFLVNHTRGGD